MNEVSLMVKSRLSAFIEHKGLTNAAFEKKCGLSNGYIRNFKGNLGVKKLEDILTSFPELSKDWLLFGTGSMLKNSEQPQNPVEEKPQERTTVDRLLFIIESQRKDIEVLIQLVKGKDEKIDELARELDARKRGCADNAALSFNADAV